MRTFLKKLFLFLLFVMVAYPIMVFVSGYFPISKALKLNLNYRIGSYGHLFTRIKEVKQLKGDVDVLFLGSSHCYRSFDPRNFPDKKTFNLGSSSQTPIQTNILLERYLDRIDPKLVIYEVYPGGFEADGVESSLDLIANDKNDWKSFRMSFELNNIKTYNTLIYAGFADAFNLNKKFTEPVKKGDDSYIPGGFVETQVQHYTYQTISKKQDWKLNQKQIETFQENISLLKKKNIKIILVYAPITKALYGSYTNNSYVDNLMNSYGLPYYNFNELMEHDDSLDFMDAHHLNQRGVNRFNSRLKEILQ
jgi:hypothetical protein